jgi:Kef-type K+ transport system membrane component KefB
MFCFKSCTPILSFLGCNGAYIHTIFPKSSITVLETVANIGILFFMFFGWDGTGFPSTFKRTASKAFLTIAAGNSLPFLASAGLGLLMFSGH